VGCSQTSASRAGNPPPRLPLSHRRCGCADLRGSFAVADAPISERPSKPSPSIGCGAVVLKKCGGRGRTEEAEVGGEGGGARRGGGGGAWRGGEFPAQRSKVIRSSIF
jgi:hypothetical protein